MTDDADRLINGHLDGCLSPEEQAQLGNWLKASVENSDRFAHAVMLHDRIRVHYLSLRAAETQLESVRSSKVRKTGKSYRLSTAAIAACLLICGILYWNIYAIPRRTAEAIEEYHRLVTIGRRDVDRKYRVTFVKDPSEQPDDRNLKHGRGEDPKFPDDPSKNTDLTRELYVRAGRQFVYVRPSVDGRKKTIYGSNGSVSWALKPDEPVEVRDPMHFTEDLPAGLYLAPILSFFAGQERMLVADYDLELRHPNKSSKTFVAVKKPDTKQGPRKIEIEISNQTGQISEMRIWPETLDLRSSSHTVVSFVEEKPLDPNWFSPQFQELARETEKQG